MLLCHDCCLLVKRHIYFFLSLSPSLYIAVIPPSGLKSDPPEFMRRRKAAPVVASSPETSEEEEKEGDEEWTPCVSGNPTLLP